MNPPNKTLKHRISIIITAYNAAETVEACLKSLKHQAQAPDVEVILVDSSTDGTADLVRRLFPWVHMICSMERLYCGSARNRGVAESNGDIIAFLDADCTAGEDWVRSVRMAHEESNPVIGGIIDNFGPCNVIGWASYFCEFSRWMVGTSAELMEDTAGANMSCKREVFTQIGSFIEGTYSSDTEFLWRLLEAGQSIHFNPDIRVYHKSIQDMSRYLKHEYQHGRAFARVRTEYRRFSAVRRILYSLFFGFISLKLFIEILIRVFRKRMYIIHWLKSSPLLFAGVFSWSLGEAAGYLKSP